VIVELAGITFRDTGRGWVFADLVDWYTLPDSKAPNDPIPQAHGSFDPGIDWRSAAAVSFTAGYVGDTEAECLAAVEQFTAVGSVETVQAMKVTDALRATSRDVSIRHIGVPDFFGYDQFEVHFAVDLLAWDPVRYGDPATASTGLPSDGGGLEYPLGDPDGALSYGANGALGRVALANDGTADTWPVFTVTGTLDEGFYIQCLDTGDVLRYDRVVPAGSTVSIDSATGEVLVDGVSDASNYLTRADFFSIPAKGSREVQFNPISTSSGTPTMTVKYRSGWW
jgi:hypothetical protein